MVTAGIVASQSVESVSCVAGLVIVRIASDATSCPPTVWLLCNSCVGLVPSQRCNQRTPCVEFPKTHSEMFDHCCTLLTTDGFVGIGAALHCWARVHNTAVILADGACGTFANQVKTRVRSRGAHGHSFEKCSLTWRRSQRRSSSAAGPFVGRPPWFLATWPEWRHLNTQRGRSLERNRALPRGQGPKVSNDVRPFHWRHEANVFSNRGGISEL